MKKVLESAVLCDLGDYIIVLYEEIYRECNDSGLNMGLHIKEYKMAEVEHVRITVR